MPELPEVEHLRRSLSRWLLGATIGEATLRRRDVLDRSAYPTAVPIATTLLERGRITAVERRGKQMALVAADGRSLVVHLGMSGQMLIESCDETPAALTHRHASWVVRQGSNRLRLVFRDPRRFGGLWAFPSLQILQSRWAALGPDGLDAPLESLNAALRPELGGSRVSKRAVKAILLDQHCIAGVGNIYADEALHRAGVHPGQSAAGLSDATRLRLASSVRAILQEAVAAGGSTLRDYVDADARPGSFQGNHRVYGRAKQPCLTCGAALRGSTIAGRTTVHCSTCQRLVHKRRKPASKTDR